MRKRWHLPGDMTVDLTEEGRFDVTSGIIIAADPAYAGGSAPHCAIKFKAKKGEWLVTFKEVGEHVASITVRHTDYLKAKPNIRLKGEVGVDTASAGFFDAKSLRGVMCMSGYSDGCYPCFVARDGKEAVAAYIVFLP